MDLNDRLKHGSGWLLLSARSINDRGWIVGVGRRRGEVRVFLLRPVR